MKKDTSKMLEELQQCSSFRKFYNENAEHIPTSTLAEYLGELLSAHGLKKSDVIKKSELSEVYAYQIFSGLRVPERRKLLCLAVGMGLTLEEVQTLLKCSGYAQLYAKNTFDCIVIFGICKSLSVPQINELLFDYGMETLG